ncbi:MAG TPA: NAD(P)-dependent oxidoreductase [Terriglobales bacterium]|nr:NAD(P)-dependent oxidoreductase [Terriglobales bacterium]
MGQPRSVVVTGGNGFVGRYLCPELTKRGWDVLSVDSCALEGKNGTAFQQCDITEAEPVEAIFKAKHYEAIIHLASILPTAAKADPHTATNVNIGGSLNILEAAKRFNLGRVIYASSSSVYGTRPASQFVSESQSLAPEDLYGAAKRYVEMLGQAYHQNSGFGFLALRIAIVVGAGVKSSTSAWRGQLIESLRAAKPTEFALPFRPDEVLPIIHVEDLVAMLVAAVSADKITASIYNSFAESVTPAELKHEVERLNAKVKVELGTAPVVGHPRAIDSRRFAKDFGIEPMPLRERLRRGAEMAAKAP